jgi:hypothetical protein
MLLAASAAATTKAAWASTRAATWATAESGRPGALRPLIAGQILADDDQVAFFQFALSHFGRRAVRDSDSDPSRLRFFIRTKHPNDADLSFHRR